MPDLCKIIIAILATWRVSASLYYGKEFSDLRYMLTAQVDDDGEPLIWYGRQISCFWCVSFWMAWPCAVLSWFMWPLALPLALSGAAVLLSGGGRTIWREATQ